MRIVGFGATGGIGQQVVEQALNAGHEVTAVARRPAAVTIQHPCLEVVAGDVLQPATIGQAVAGKDAVLSSLGARDRGPTSVYSEGVTNIMRAMQAARVRRLICISASGLEPGPLIQRLFARPLLWTFLKNMYTDLALMETLVKRSSLDWTIVRPPRLTDGPRTGRYQIATNRQLSRIWTISRADVADYMLAHLTDPSSYCGVVEIAY